MQLQLSKNQTYESSLPQNQPSNLPSSEDRKTMTLSMVGSLQRNSKKKEKSNVGVNDIIRSIMRFFRCKICQNNFWLISTSILQRLLNSISIYKIKINQDILCPEEGCKQKLTPNCQLFSQLPIQMQQKYKEYQLGKQKLNNPSVKLCSRKKCDGLIDLLKKPQECQKCRSKFCKQCMLDPELQIMEKMSQMLYVDKKKLRISITCASCAYKIGHQLITYAREHTKRYSSVDKCDALFYILWLLLLIPIFIVLDLLILVVGLGLAIFLGAPVFISLVDIWAKNSNCCSSILPPLLATLIEMITFLILAPVAYICGLIAAPIGLFAIWCTFTISIACQCYNTLKFLFEQLD